MNKKAAKLKSIKTNSFLPIERNMPSVMPNDECIMSCEYFSVLRKKQNALEPHYMSTSLIFWLNGGCIQITPQHQKSIT